jgi:tetratricopeptide (TPR) repeat protein
MYFSAEWQERIVRRLAQALTPGGWLLVGPCDLTSSQAAAVELRPHRPGAFHKLGPETIETRRRRNPELATVPNAAESVGGSGRDVLGAFPPAAVVVQPIMERSNDSAGADVSTLAELAREEADRGELEAALRDCDAALARDALRPELHHLRACVLLELDRVEEAESAFRRVLYLDADFAMAQFALGMLAQRAGRGAEARHHFSVVLRLLARRQRGEAVPHSEGLTVARLQAVVERTLGNDAA